MRTTNPPTTTTKNARTKPAPRATAVRAPHFGPRYDRRRPHAPQILHLECPRLLQLGHEQVALREPAHAAIDRAA